MLSFFYHLLCYSKNFICSSGSFKSLALSFCFFSFANEITLFACCLPFLYSFHASVDLSFFQFPCFFFFFLTALATSSFHHHVSLCLHGPFDNPHVTCDVSIIIFFICCQCSFTSEYFHSASYALFLTMLWYSSHVFSSLSFHTCTLGSNFLRHPFVVLNRIYVANNLCFGTHSSFGMSLTLRTFALSSCCTII